MVRGDIDIYAIDVEGVEPNSPYWTGAWVQLPPGQSHSISLDAPDGGFLSGSYRVELRVGGQRRSALFSVAPEYPLAQLEGEAAPKVGRNIALSALGGSVEASSEHGQRYALRLINDGMSWIASPGTNDTCVNCGWASAEGDARPSLTFRFNENREAGISAVVIDTRIFTPGGESPDRMLPWLPKIVGISVSRDGDATFNRVATSQLRRTMGRQIVRLPEGIRAASLRIDVLETRGASGVVLSEVEVLEAPGSESVADDVAVDLARAAVGGVIVSYTGAHPDAPPSALFDGDARDTRWVSMDDYFPQDFTLAFDADEAALIDEVRLDLSDRDDPSTWPSLVAIALSAENPIGPFNEVGRFPIERRAGSQSFPVGAEARYVKVRLLENYGGPRTALGGLSVIEGKSDGYVPIALRERDESLASDLAPRPPDWDQALDEVEPNDTAAEANLLAFGEGKRGAIDPLGEVDYLALPDLPEDATSVTLQVAGEPHIRHTIDLLNDDGDVVQHYDPGQNPASQARLTFVLLGGERMARLSEPGASAVLAWDTSGSMRGQEGDLERAVRDYVNRAPRAQNSATPAILRRRSRCSYAILRPTRPRCARRSQTTSGRTAQHGSTTVSRRRRRCSSRPRAIVRSS